MIYYYYKIKNKITDKNYIGITTNPTRRKQEHWNSLQKHSHVNWNLQNAWDKNGYENFSFEVIEYKDYNTPQEAYDHEWELIQKYGDYNILQGALVNPMYTSAIREKMIKTKQSQVDNIYQIKTISEVENKYLIVRQWNSMKEASRIGHYDFRNICKSIKTFTKEDGYYWVKMTELEKWFPVSQYNNFIAEIDINDNIIQVARSPIIIENKEGWATSSIINAIKRNGKTHNRKFKFISQEEYLLYKPLIIETCID